MKNIAIAYNAEHETFKIVYTEFNVGESYRGVHKELGVLDYHILRAEECTENGVKFAKLIFSNRIKRSRRMTSGAKTFELRLRATMHLLTIMSKMTPEQQDMAYEQYVAQLNANREARFNSMVRGMARFLATL